MLMMMGRRCQRFLVKTEADSEKVLDTVHAELVADDNVAVLFAS